MSLILEVERRESAGLQDPGALAASPEVSASPEAPLPEVSASPEAPTPKESTPPEGSPFKSLSASQAISVYREVSTSPDAKVAPKKYKKPRAPRAPGAMKIPKAPRAPRAPKAPKIPKAPKVIKEYKAPSVGASPSAGRKRRRGGDDSAETEASKVPRERPSKIPRLGDANASAGTQVALPPPRPLSQSPALPASPGALDRAVARLRRGGVPPGDRPKLLLSYCARNGLRPATAQIAALDAPPGAAIEAAEAAGVRLTLADLAGAPPAPPSPDAVFQTLYHTCPKRRWIVDNAARVAAHCGATSPADVSAVLREDAHRFLRAVGAEISFEEAVACVGKRSWQFKEYAPMVTGLDIHGVRRFYQTCVVVPSHVCETMKAVGLGVTADSLAHACGQDGSWNGSLIGCVMALGLAVDCRRALAEYWPPKLLWRLFSRDAHLPEVRAAFDRRVDAVPAVFPGPAFPGQAFNGQAFAGPAFNGPLLPAPWVREWAAELLGYKRRVRVLQRAFRKALRSRAARKIQRLWRRATSDPSRSVGRRRLLRMFREAVDGSPLASVGGSSLASVGASCSFSGARRSFTGATCSGDGQQPPRDGLGELDGHGVADARPRLGQAVW